VSARASRHPREDVEIPSTGSRREEEPQVSPTTDKPVAETRFAPGDRLLWRGRLVQIVDMARLSPTHEQVVLHFLDRPNALPVSVPVTDLSDATRV
jgi:hypothetical protein